MDLNKLITKRIKEYALNGDANLLDQYGFLITMIAKEYAAQQLILSGVSQQRELLNFRRFMVKGGYGSDEIRSITKESIDDFIKFNCC